MIEQIAVPTPSEIARVRAMTPQREIPLTSGPKTVQIINQAFSDHEALLAKMEAAQGDLDSMLNDGWHIIGTCPFAKGEGINYMLRKMPRPSDRNIVDVIAVAIKNQTNPNIISSMANFEAKDRYLLIKDVLPFVPDAHKYEVMALKEAMLDTYRLEE